MSTKGTKEWAEKNINISYGCSNNCKYCYAKRMALRFERIKNEDEWKTMRPNKKAIDRNYKKTSKRIMFPTSHDITEENINDYIIVLKKLLEAGNNILIVTKANYNVMDELYAQVFAKDDNIPKKKYINQVEFRITITTIDHKLEEKWEPNAPPFWYQRFAILSLLHGLGYKTSVSIEPFLDEDPIELIKIIEPYCYTIWLGIMSGINYKYHSLTNLVKILKNLRKLPNNIKEKIRLKDSIVNKLRLNSNRIGD